MILSDFYRLSRVSESYGEERKNSSGMGNLKLGSNRDEVDLLLILIDIK